MRTCLLAWWVLLSGVGSLVAAAPSKKPNIVFILADDLGWGDLKCYGHPLARTPNLDRLAQEGTRFTQAYMTGITCCPSRTGLMTGKFPARFKEYPASYGLGKEITVTELLKRAGYHTGHFGKWHIGPTTKPGTYGIDVINSVTENKTTTRKRTDERGRDAGIFDQAIQFLEKHKEGPFYVQIWGHISHFPINPPEGLVRRFSDLAVTDDHFARPFHDKLQWVRKNGGDVQERMRRYLAEVSALDDCVGRVLKKLDQLGLRENTIVVFSSDHGPVEGQLPGKARNWSESDRKKRLDQQMNMLGYAGPHRGGKHGMYEGGVRVPFLVRWPGNVRANEVNASVISGIDWLPTVCRLADVKVSFEGLDGEDISDIWQGKQRARTQPLFWKTNNVRSKLCIREGKWKLHDPNRTRGEVELYDLSIDPGESKNLAATHPQLVERLQTRLRNWNTTLPREYLKIKEED